ncbi:hypothetical protein Hanom_Chr10g00907881 [Helianthus anomalus]
MNVQHPNLPKADNDLLKIDTKIEHSLKIFRGVALNRYKESKPPRKLFGAFDKTDYVAPENDKWRHNDSQSDDKEPKLKKMMEDKFGRKKINIFGDSTESDNDDDGDDEGGDGGDAGASAAGIAGASLAGGDEEDRESDDNQPEPGYEFYLDERGVRKVRKIRQEDDADFVPSDTEAERLKRKQTVARTKKKARKYIGASSVQQSVPQQDPIQEADMNLNLGFTADEAATFISSPPRSSEPTHVVTSALETQTTTPQEPAHSIASIIQATTSQPSSERRHRRFYEMQQDEKVDFLFTQLQATAGQIDRQSTVIHVTRSDMIKQQLEKNALNSTVQRQQAEITRQQAEIEQLKAENARLKTADEERESRSTDVQRLAETLKEKHDDMKEWYNIRNTKITDGVKRITDGFDALRKRVNILWGDRCKQQEVLKKRDHDSEDPGNPDPSATSEQPPATASTQIVVFKPSQFGSPQGTSVGTVEEVKQLEIRSYIESSMAGTSFVPSSTNIALHGVHPITGEVLEEGEIVADLSHEQLNALNKIKEIDDVVIDDIPSEPETANLENVEEIVFEGGDKKSTYVREDGTEFTPFNEEWLKENVDVIDDQLKNRDTSDNASDAFTEWKKQFLSKVSKPMPAEVQVDYLKYEKENLHRNILCWMFVKEIHCMAIKCEYGIQYFRSLLSILSLPFYDVAALTKLELINRSNFEGATLFACKIKMNKRTGWKDELYKP